MSYAADDTQSIAQRMKELQAERDLALKGTSAPMDGQAPKTELSDCPMYGYPAGFSRAQYQEALNQYARIKADCEALTSKPVFLLNSDYGY
jgi:hypothetical protein